MITLLMTLFIILSLLLSLFILIQQGKGDMGLGSLGNSGQLIFGGSGGQEFFERGTWIMVILFILGSLGLVILKSHASESSRISDYRVTPVSAPATAGNTEQAPVSSEAPTNQA